VAVRVASAAAIISATGPSVGVVVGASAVAASAARVAVGDDLTIAGSSCGWAEPAARLEYGYGRGPRCDL
jgi:hypothetical protein